ncbi:NAD(P)H nitroreductase [Shewanella yunxiaonensis]|uniref:Putative NAD(P)H nitroreductase n=1 Tax=Shewanella yunxiaonensis TaxID=2829809 RepID=A0ABX7YXS9_9GAMM|nr:MULTISPECIES: NAD(P)H nitroreductase [Shewanella]MDF0533529.1 NAD(P)H nitroreductase [Shewanella sp. A32]QUN07141.1 NAD(P)H nitroreductase [Shewanella yunxiaonensis]
MDALTLLLTRQSCPRLIAPAPSEAQLKVILDAAARVPDHGGLTPWEFIIATGEGLNRLADVFVAAATEAGEDDDFIAKAGNMPLRAPMVITVVAKTRSDIKKVPELEQQLAAGCAVMAMQQAAFAQGLGGIWRTGNFAFDETVNTALGLEVTDQIVGFLYLGTPAIDMPLKPQKDGSAFARYL